MAFRNRLARWRFRRLYSFSGVALIVRSRFRGQDLSYQQVIHNKNGLWGHSYKPIQTKEMCEIAGKLPIFAQTGSNLE